LPDGCIAGLRLVGCRAQVAAAPFQQALPPRTLPYTNREHGRKFASKTLALRSVTRDSELEGVPSDGIRNRPPSEWRLGFAFGQPGARHGPGRAL